MSASPRDMVGPEIVTQETMLLDAAERWERLRDGRFAAHLHLSRLKPQNRQEGYLRVAVRMLEPMVSAYGGQIFTLSNDDIVFMVNQPNPSDLRDHLHKLRGLFSKDPLTQEDSGDGSDLFCTLYDLTFDFEAFRTAVKELLAAARAQMRAPQRASELRPLDANSLGVVLDRLGMLDATPFVRRQSAVALTGHGQAEVIFQEFFISLADLQKAVAPEINIHTNRWMFQHLASSLDQRLLAALQHLRLTHMPPAIHVNLNLASLADPSFIAFATGLATEIGLGIELQILDVLADSRAFFVTRAALREKKTKLVIDGLDEATLRFMDLSRTGADLYKIDWNPELAQPGRGDVIKAGIKSLDPTKILLARCDSEIAIAWGLEQGFSQFQGRYVEVMLAATTMAVCENASACTMAQCVQRHGVISGGLRGECGNLPRLDKAPAMRAPQRKSK